jgi:O-antigen/teichoic acid export membrane protein
MSRAARFIRNVLWSWGGVAVTIAASLFISPFIIRRIGDANYGIWTLVLSLVEYYWLIDLGFRSATIKFSAEFKTKEDHQQLSELLSTGLVYSSLAALGIAIASILFAPFVASQFKVDQPEFPTLLRIVGVSWALGMVFNVFSGCIEGFQRFDYLSRVWIMTTVLRSIFVVIALLQGHGVLALGWVLLLTQSLSYIATWLLFRRLSPHIHLSWKLANKGMLKQMSSYGVHTLTGQVATRLLSSGPPIVIAYFLPVRFLAYYAVPGRILEYAMDGIGRIGSVTAPNATEMMTRGEEHMLADMGVIANRYCLALFLPVVIFLLVYGPQVYTLWLKKPDFVQQSAFLIPILLLGQTAACGQFNSISILFGIGRHRNYVRCLLAESILVVAGLAITLPRFGLAGAAWTVTILMSLNRAAVVAVLISHELHLNALDYVARIYVRPLLIGTASWLTLLLIRQNLLLGRTWPELIAAGCLMMIPYTLLSYALCLRSDHRLKIKTKLLSLLGLQRPVDA